MFWWKLLVAVGVGSLVVHGNENGSPLSDEKSVEQTRGMSF